MSRDRSLSADLTVGWRIVRADTVRQWRRLRGNRRLLALAVLVALLVLPVALGASRWLYGVGQQSRDGLGVPVVAVARNLLVPSPSIRSSAG